jgi:DMSO/TMAO reductase YedYZ molybdopterin-dependent catalytic subunit
MKSPTVLHKDRLPPGQTKTDKFPVLSLTAPPCFDPATWRLKIGGLVEKPLSLTWDEFLKLPAVELEADFHCVTTWSRLDNLWEGVLATTIRDLVKVKPEAKFVLQHGLEGYTTNLALADFFQPDVMLACKHDGAFIPPEHGAPLRVITPQLYAWKGAKFLCGLDFLAEDQRGYWEARGYHNHGDPWTEERFWE